MDAVALLSFLLLTLLVSLLVCFFKQACFNEAAGSVCEHCYCCLWMWEFEFVTTIKQDLKVPCFVNTALAPEGFATSRPAASNTRCHSESKHSIYPSASNNKAVHASYNNVEGPAGIADCNPMLAAWCC